MKLALVATCIARRQRGDNLCSRVPLRKEPQALRPIQRIHQSLGGQGAHATLRVDAKRAYRKKPAGDCNAENAFFIAGKDGPCHWPIVHNGWPIENAAWR